jgi:hypothetical protein
MKHDSFPQLRRRLVAGLALAILSIPIAFGGAAFADGPETGVVAGTVTDASGSPLPGVLVTITGTRGDKTQVTDANGQYTFGLMPPGQYALKAELEGFTNAEGTATVVAGGRQQVPLRLGLSTSEEITVTSEAPLVDKYNVTAGATIEAETAGEIAATVRSFYGALQVLPGVTNDVESMDLSQSRPTVNGALWQESNVYVDGVDATYSMRGGGTRVFLPSSALSEVSLEAGGGGAEYGRNVGSHTNLIVKSGTNRFHGDLAGVYGKQSWNSNWDPQPILGEDTNFVRTFLDQGQTLEQARESATNWIVYQPGERDGDDVNIEASIGGPIKRDKAWFFLARGETSTSQLDKTLDGQLFNNSSELFATIGKFNVQPGANHSLAYTYIDAPVDRIFLLPPMGDRYNATFFDLSGDVNSLSWNWSVNQDVFLEAKIARQVSDENRRIPFPPEVKFADPRYAPDPALGAYSPNNNVNAFVQNFDNTWLNGWIFGDGFGLNQFPREQVNAAMTQFAGASHELKYGLDLQQVEWNADVQRPNIQTAYDFQLGTQYGAANNCIGSAADVAAGGEDTRCFLVDYNGHGLTRGTADSDGDNYGAYIRDRFSVGDHWTFNLGLRVEQQTLSNDRGRDVIDSTDFSPRINAVYDLKGDGRQLLTFNAGRFFVQTPQWLVNGQLEEDWNGASNTYDLFMHASSVNSAAFGALPPAIICNVLAGLGLPVVNDRGPYCFNLGSVRPGQMFEYVDAGLFDSDIEPYHRDEVVLGYEWQFNNNWAFDAKGIWWQLDNLIGTTLQRGPDFELFQLTANYDDLPDILRAIGFEDNFVQGNLPADGTPEQEAALRAQANTILANFEDDRREYQALQLQLNRRFAKGWAWYNNVTFSKVEGRTYGGGNGGNDLGAFNNLDDDYGRNLEVVLTDALLDTLAARPDFCASQRLPASCVDALRPLVGQPLSTLNREGEMPVDRPVIFKSYGYRQWNVGNQDFNLGGMFVWQSGSPWQKTLAISNPNVSLGDNARNTTINTFLVPRGTFENEDFYWLNLSGAWGFPLGSRLRGQLRLELTNITDEQEQVATSDRTGLPLRSRRSFQQPRKVRVLASLRF